MSSPLAATLRRIERASGTLATQSVARMDEQLAWFREMPPDQRSWITLVAQAGIANFVEWLRQPGTAPSPIDQVFGTAPPEMARRVSLQQTVELVRLTVEVVETGVEHLAAPGEEVALREAVLRYSREVAFAAAQVYAGVAESRGAWDARLEAIVVDSLLRGETDEATPGRAAALGWGSVGQIVVAVGSAPPGEPEAVLAAIQHSAHTHGLPALAGVHGTQLLIVLGSVQDPTAAVTALLGEYGPGPVVIGPTVPDLGRAAASAQAALAGWNAAAGWPNAPRPVLADDLLPERALLGDEVARAALIEQIYTPLAQSSGPLLETLSGYLERGGALESTARALFVHPNTIRYRLRRVSELTGRTATVARHAFELQVALILGRLGSAGAHM